MLRRLHQVVPPPGLVSFAYTGEPLAQFLTGRLRIEAERAEQAGLLDHARLTRLTAPASAAFAHVGEALSTVLLHGDCQPAHFLLTPQTTVAAVIDFGDASVGDPVLDLAVLTTGAPQHLPAVLASYRPDEALSRRIAQLIEPLRTLRRLGAANWLHANGLDPTVELGALLAAPSPPAR